MGVMSHDVELSDSYLSCNVDSIKRNLLWNENQNTTMIKNVYGQMYLKNNTDSVVYLSSSTKKHYAVVDGQDSYGDTSMFCMEKGNSSIRRKSMSFLPAMPF